MASISMPVFDCSRGALSCIGVCYKISRRELFLWVSSVSASPKSHGIEPVKKTRFLLLLEQIMEPPLCTILTAKVRVPDQISKLLL